MHSLSPVSLDKALRVKTPEWDGFGQEIVARVRHIAPQLEFPASSALAFIR